MYANAKSRRGRQWFQDAQALLEGKGLTLEERQIFTNPRALSAQVEQAVSRGVPLVLVGGGDGTLSLIARHFVGSSSVLGVLPLGTGNAFARDLEIPSRLEDACEIIARGRTVSVDLGYAGADYFVNVATVGLSVQIAAELTNEAKKRFGRAAYLFAVGRALGQVRPFHSILRTAEGVLEFDTLQVVIGNGRYHAGPFPLAPDASITEGKLSVYALATTNRAAFLKLAWALRLGRQCDLPEVFSLSTAEGRLETSPRSRVVIDGEVAATTPLDFKVVPDAIKTRVPLTFS